MILDQHRRVRWVFVCQKGKLEPQACLLAASLRHVLGDSALLTAALPQPLHLVGEISEPVRDFMQRLGVELRTFHNPLLRKKNQGLRLLMNKACTLTLDAESDTIVFLDSDQLCLAKVDPRLFAIPMWGRPARFPGVEGMDGLWEHAYQLCGADLPMQQMFHFSSSLASPATAISPPAFNSGFISVDQVWTHQLQQAYFACFHELWQNDLLGRHRYFTEQVALSIAVSRIKIPYHLDDRWIDRSFLHYYKPTALAKSINAINDLIRPLVKKYPELKSILASFPDWTPLLEALQGNSKHLRSQ